MKKVFIPIILGLIISSKSISAQSKVDLSSVYDSLKDAEYEDVITKLDQIKNNDLTFLQAKHYLKGLSYSRLQDYPRAIYEYKLSISKGNKTGDLYYELGQALYAENDLNLARKAFIQAANLNTKKSQSNYYVAHISQILEEFKVSKKYFEEILKDNEASKDLKQFSRFQLAESLLSMARPSNEAATIVEKYVLPQMNKALEEDKKSETAKDIEKRITEIQKEFGLDPNLMRNGKEIPEKRFNISFSQEMKYDNNYTLTSELPETKESQADTYILTSEVSLSYSFIIDRKFIIKPSLTLEKIYNTNRDDEEIYSNDANNIDGDIKFSLENKMFGKPSSIYFSVGHEYNAEDRESNKSIIFNSRSNILEAGVRFKYFSVGDSHFKIKTKNLTSYSESLNYDATTFSIDQTYMLSKSLLLFLAVYNSNNYINDESQNTTSNTFRIDYIKPNLFPKITANLGLSYTLQNYEDTTKDEQRGTETTLTYNLKLSRDVTKDLSCDFEYNYTKASSELEESNYSKHETSFKLNLSY